jgi:hypothetical protein
MLDGRDGQVNEGHNPRMSYLKATLAGLFAFATYLCFLTWIHMKATSIAEERRNTGFDRSVRQPGLCFAFTRLLGSRSNRAR